MKTITIKEGCSTPVCLGEKGENGVSAVLFDYSEWISDFGEGAISLLVKRKGDQSAYPVVLSTADGIATWTISDTDTAVQGYGKAEYIFTIDSKVAKSAVFSFYVAADLGPAGDPPDPYESWIDTLTELGGETLINAQAAQAAQEAAETAQSNAETAATNAATSATNAAQSAGAARFAAESALASADSASASATAASGHATAAETAKDLAISAAEDAQHSETQAELSASAAAESAESASGSATTATTAAQNAATSASNASGSATAAATSETNAASSATSAAASATEAATEAAKLNNYLPTDTASGAIASFPDGADSVPVEALTVSLEPIQDLHGQSSPYPPGGGANLFDLDKATLASQTYGFTITRNGDYVVISGTSTNTGNLSFNIITNYADYSLSGKGYVLQVFNVTSGYTVGSAWGFRTETEKTFAIRLDGITQGQNVNVSMKLSVSATSQSAWSPYENICPITGHTQAVVTRTGVNVWDEEWRLASLNTTTGAWSSIGTYSQIASVNMIPVKPNTTYYFTSPNDGGAYMAEYRADGSYIGYAFTRAANRAFTTPSDCAFVMFQMNGYGTTYNNDISINYPSTDHDYHAHSIVHISIPLGQTVYGGTLDVVNGVLTVDRAIVDMGTLTWTKNSNTGRFYALLSPAPPLYSYLVVANAKCSTYPIVSWRNISDKKASVFYANVNGINVEDSAYTNAATFKTAMSGQQLVYELAEPITIDLTDIPTISTLLGQNNVWSDSGDVSVTYRADIQLYISKMIAEALA